MKKLYKYNDKTSQEPSQKTWEDRFDLEMNDCLVIPVYDTEQFKKAKEFVREERRSWLMKNHKLLADMESCATAKECRHLLKDLLLEEGI